MTERHTVRTAIGALLLAALLVACDATTDDAEQGAADRELPTPEEAEEGADPVEADEDDDEQVPGNELVIAGEAYTPRDLLVGADRELRIVNEDDVEHTVTAWDGSFHAEVPAGETVTMTTPEPGAYPYVCEIHEHMRADLETM